MVQQKLKAVAECLYKADSSGIYYAIYKRDGKQIKRSLKTKDFALAKRRLREEEKKLKKLDVNKARATFGDVLKHYRETDFAAKDIKSTTRTDVECRLKRIHEYWEGKLTETRIANITTADAKKWFANRKP